MNVLLTGGAGFIGSHLADHLLTMGYVVHILDNFYPNYDPTLKRQNISNSFCHPNYYLHEGDIRDTELLNDLFGEHAFSLVVHLAALPGVQASFLRPDEYADINVTGTRNLLDAMQRAGVTKLVYGSSSSVYGENSPLPLRETYQPLQPISPYANTKYQAEQVCQQYYQQFGIETACLRFFTAYGPRQRPDMAIHQFLTALLRQQPIIIYGHGSSRDYTYVSDIVQGISKAMQHVRGFEVYNIGSGTTISLPQLIKTLETVTGYRAIDAHAPNRPGDVTHTYADLTKARQELLYEPAVGLPEGIRRMADAMNWI
jgi:UDP-glucuronate 4-epimerase